MAVQSDDRQPRPQNPHDQTSAIHPGVYAPVVEKTNLQVNDSEGRLQIVLPETANIARDTIGRHAVGAKADYPALIYEDESGGIHRYTFAELDRLSTRFAAALAERGVARGEPVAVHTGQTPETAIAHLAIYKLGAVVLTLSQLYGLDTIEHILMTRKPGSSLPSRQAGISLARPGSASRASSTRFCVATRGTRVRRDSMTVWAHKQPG